MLCVVTTICKQDVKKISDFPQIFHCMKTRQVLDQMSLMINMNELMQATEQKIRKGTIFTNISVNRLSDRLNKICGDFGH